MTPIQIAVPAALTAQQAELEATLAGISSEEQKLATLRQELQAALTTLATGIAVLSGQPLPASKVAPTTTRKPMSPEARQRIGEGLRRYREAQALAKAAQATASAPPASAPEPADAPVVAASEPLGEVPADAPVLGSEPQELADAPSDVPVALTARKPGKDRKAARA